MLGKHTWLLPNSVSTMGRFCVSTTDLYSQSPGLSLLSYGDKTHCLSGMPWTAHNAPLNANQPKSTQFAKHFVSRSAQFSFKKKMFFLLKVNVVPFIVFNEATLVDYSWYIYCSIFSCAEETAFVKWQMPACKHHVWCIAAKFARDIPPTMAHCSGNISHVDPTLVKHWSQQTRDVDPMPG